MIVGIIFRTLHFRATHTKNNIVFSELQVSFFKSYEILAVNNIDPDSGSKSFPLV